MGIIPLLAMTGLHFASMYLLMYLMVDQINNIYPNLNQVYMASAMTVPMVLFEIMLMYSMYKNRFAVQFIAFLSVIVFIASFWAIRTQAAIKDKEFIKSMIPHHAGAILMCEKAKLTDSELEELCRQIIDSQQSEISQMKSILDRIE